MRDFLFHPKKTKEDARDYTCKHCGFELLLATDLECPLCEILLPVEEEERTPLS